MWYLYLFFSVPLILTGSVFYFIDLHTSLKNRRYKYNPDIKLKEIYDKIMPLVLFNLFLTHPILSYITSKFIYIDKHFDSIDCIYDIFRMLITYEVAFYFLHRLFHVSFLYNKIHKVHHQLKICVAFGGIYIHPIEYIFGSFLPGFIGLVMIKNHNLYTLCILSILAGSGACLTHCGYYGNHIKHHYLKYCHFDIYDYLDYIFDTLE